MTPINDLIKELREAHKKTYSGEMVGFAGIFSVKTSTGEKSLVGVNGPRTVAPSGETFDSQHLTKIYNALPAILDAFEEMQSALETYASCDYCEIFNGESVETDLCCCGAARAVLAKIKGEEG